MPRKAETTEKHPPCVATAGAPDPQVGASPSFLHCRKLLRRFAEYDAPVLLQGETGTGKDLAARAIHYGSARRDRPFVPVNCGALPDSLIENELFGHEAGAYTDARERHRGLVEQAADGTLFFDEIEALSPRAQASLLRFLEDREFRPLGGGPARRSRARVIAATNIQLQRLVEERKFRLDLYFRLNILTVTMPPLRERDGDVLLLANHFIEKYSAQYSKRGLSLHPRTLAWLLSYDWPGNVRELQNLIHREILLAEGPVLDFVGPMPRNSPARNAALPSAPLDQSIENLMDLEFQDAKAQLIEMFERLYLTRLMAETEGNVSLAARRAGKERRALGKLIKKHSIDRQDYLRQAQA